MVHVHLNYPACRKALTGALMAALVFAPAVRASTWNMLQINAAQAHAMGLTGKGVVVGVIDGGFNLGHPAFRGRVSGFARSFLDPDPNDVKDGEDSGGHGTHVAGIIGAARGSGPMYGVAYDATILPIKAIGAPTFEGYDYPDPVGAAFDHAIAKRVGVINGSFGPAARPEKYIYDPWRGYRFPNPNYRVMNHQILIFDESEGKPYESGEAEYIQAAADADIVVVFAAGNEFRDQPVASLHPTGAGMLPFIRPENHGKDIYRYVRYGGTYRPNLNNPKTYTYVEPTNVGIAQADYSKLEGALITVVALDNKARISSYSNRCGVAWRWCLAAPGGDNDATGHSTPDSSILSTLPINRYGVMSGTSMASPTVAGAAAVVRGAFPYMTARQTIELLLTTANTTGHLADRATYGRGLLDVGRAAQGPREFGAEGFAQVFDIDTKGFDTHWLGDITGSGGVTKRGAGLLHMTGRNTYRGDTTILAGSLQMDGATSYSNTFIDTEATISGTGTAGPTTVAGTLSPGAEDGNRIGTLSIAGDLTQLPGSRYPVVIDTDGISDSVSVNGNATIEGASISVAGFNPAKLGQTFRILSTTGAINGNYTNTTETGYPFIGLGLRAVQEGTQSAMQLDVKRTALAFADVVDTSNQRAAATAVDSLPVGNAIYDTVVSARDLAPIAGHMDMLSGELHASLQSGVLAMSGAQRNAVLGRLRDPALRAPSTTTPGFLSSLARQPLAANDGFDFIATRHIAPQDTHRSFWGDYINARSHYGAHAGMSAMTGRSNGFAFGADHAFTDALQAGLSVSYAESSLRVRERQSQANLDSYALAVYASLKTGPTVLRGTAAIGWHDIATRRQAAIVPGTLNAHYRARSAQAYAEIAYPLTLGSVRVEPLFGLGYAHMRTPGWHESGSIAALSSERQNADTALSVLGVRGATQIELSKTSIGLNALLAWEHTLSGGQQSATMRLDASAPFTVQGVAQARDALRLEAGVEAAVAKAATISLAYTGILSDHARDHAARVRMRWYY